MRDLDSIKYMIPCVYPRQLLKQHLYRFSRFFSRVSPGMPWHGVYSKNRFFALGSGPHQIHGSLAHPNPQPKLHHHRFGCLCTAHGRQSIHFTMSALSPQIALPMG